MGSLDVDDTNSLNDAVDDTRDELIVHDTITNEREEPDEPKGKENDVALDETLITVDATPINIESDEPESNRDIRPKLNKTIAFKLMNENVWRKGKVVSVG